MMSWRRSHFLQKVLDLRAMEGISIVAHVISVSDADEANAEPVSTSSCKAEVEGVICVEIWGCRQNRLSVTARLFTDTCLYT